MGLRSLSLKSLIIGFLGGFLNDSLHSQPFSLYIVRFPWAFSEMQRWRFPWWFPLKRWRERKLCLLSATYNVWKLVIPILRYQYTNTDGNNILHTPLVKHYNDLLGRQSSERGKDEVSYFYVGDVFCIHLGTKYADFQE